MKIRATLAVALFAPTLLVGIGTTSPAFAASCHGEPCTGDGPVATGCDDDGEIVATTGIHTAYGYTFAQLVHSERCKSYWARGQSLNTGAGGPSNYTVRIQRALVQNGDITYENKEQIVDNNNHAYDWTLMASGNNGVSMIRACSYVSKKNSGDDTWHCTGWRKNGLAEF